MISKHLPPPWRLRMKTVNIANREDESNGYTLSDFQLDPEEPRDDAAFAAALPWYSMFLSRILGHASTPLVVKKAGNPYQAALREIVSGNDTLHHRIKLANAGWKLKRSLKTEQLHDANARHSYDANADFRRDLANLYESIEPCVLGMNAQLSVRHFVWLAWDQLSDLIWSSERLKALTMHYPYWADVAHIQHNIQQAIFRADIEEVAEEIGEIEELPFMQLFLLVRYIATFKFSPKYDQITEEDNLVFLHKYCKQIELALEAAIQEEKAAGPEDLLSWLNIAEYKDNILYCTNQVRRFVADRARRAE